MVKTTKKQILKDVFARQQTGKAPVGHKRIQEYQETIDDENRQVSQARSHKAREKGYTKLNQKLRAKGRYSSKEDLAANPHIPNLNFDDEVAMEASQYERRMNSVNAYMQYRLDKGERLTKDRHGVEDPRTGVDFDRATILYNQVADSYFDNPEPFMDEGENQLGDLRLNEARLRVGVRRDDRETLDQVRDWTEFYHPEDVNPIIAERKSKFVFDDWLEDRDDTASFNWFDKRGGGYHVLDREQDKKFEESAKKVSQMQAVEYEHA